MKCLQEALQQFEIIAQTKKTIKHLRIIVLHYLGQRWSTVAVASVDPRADNP